LNIERSLQAQLNRQIKTLESENVKLKDDLSFFESLLPTNTGADGIAIRRFKVEMTEPGQLRYRLLLMQGGKLVPEFSGNYQLVLTLAQEGKSAMMTFPKIGCHRQIQAFVQTLSARRRGAYPAGRRDSKVSPDQGS
jgi:hypothetical protein